MFPSHVLVLRPETNFNNTHHLLLWFIYANSCQFFHQSMLAQVITRKSQDTWTCYSFLLSFLLLRSGNEMHT